MGHGCHSFFYDITRGCYEPTPVVMTVASRRETLPAHGDGGPPSSARRCASNPNVLGPLRAPEKWSRREKGMFWLYGIDISSITIEIYIYMIYWYIIWRRACFVFPSSLWNRWCNLQSIMILYDSCIQIHHYHYCLINGDILLLLPFDYI